MSQLTWDGVGERFYETGVDRGVLYVSGQPSVAWNGLTSIDESPVEDAVKSYYLDGVMYMQVPNVEEFEATINALHRPLEFSACDGIGVGLNGLFITQQRRRTFGLSYRTLVRNDNGEQGYKIHIIYNALAAPSARSNESLSDSVNPSRYSWKITALPELIEGFNHTPHLIVDSSVASPAALAALEDILYGTMSDDPRLPSPSEVQEIFGYVIVVTDLGDGSFTVSGPDEIVFLVDPVTFQVISSSAVVIDTDTFQLSSS